MTVTITLAMNPKMSTQNRLFSLLRPYLSSAEARITYSSSPQHSEARSPHSVRGGIVVVRISGSHLTGCRKPESIHHRRNCRSACWRCCIPAPFTEHRVDGILIDDLQHVVVHLLHLDQQAGGRQRFGFQTGIEFLLTMGRRQQVDAGRKYQ